MFAEVFATTVNAGAKAGFTGGRASALGDVISRYNTQMAARGFGALR
jgi:hypothetical protein